ncbi:MAG TPA: hypothetical protein EYQ31_15130, partial [Candidatus Handelsmanbacteria bacterium]|nr:hypothetical protein [Candidatus Handelsmanbacteria bacterium]
KLHALMKLDLRPSVIDRRKLAVWFAFWGEVNSRPRYQTVCAESDEYYYNVLCSLCDELIAEGGYEVDRANTYSKNGPGPVALGINEAVRKTYLALADRLPTQGTGQ